MDNFDLKKYLAEGKLGEESQAKQLSTKINDAIVSIDDSMSYKDFAQAVALVLKEEYGTHLFKIFIEELVKNLKN